MKSLRRQLTLSMLACALLVLAAAGGLLYASVRHALTAQFDRGLADKAGALGALLESDGTDIEFSFADGAMPEFRGGPEAEYFQLWFQDGTEAQRSESLGAASLPWRFGSADSPEIWDLPLPDGRPGRALGIAVPAYAKDAPAPIAVEDLPLVTIVVARSRAGLDGSLAALVTGLLVAAGAAVLLVWWSVTVCVRRGLAPLHSLSRQVEAMDAASLSRRVPLEGVPEELSPSVVKLNELFGRLEAAFAKERRMTAAMAHELRTPIAELRSAADVAQRWPDDGDLAADLLDTAGDVAVRMGAAVEALMRYCRLEAGQVEAQRERIAVRELLEEQWRARAHRAEARPVRWCNDVPGEAAVVSDRGLLALVFGNLLDNAASFASAGAVRAWTTATDGALTVHVGNETDQLAAGDLAHLCEPFWRKDAARSDGRHSGFGLTLVASIAEVLGSALQFQLVERQFIVSITLPTASGAARTGGTPERREVSVNAREAPATAAPSVGTVPLPGNP